MKTTGIASASAIGFFDRSFAQNSNGGSSSVNVTPDNWLIHEVGAGIFSAEDSHSYSVYGDGTGGASEVYVEATITNDLEGSCQSSGVKVTIKVKGGVRGAGNVPAGTKSFPGLFKYDGGATPNSNAPANYMGDGPNKNAGTPTGANEEYSPTIEHTIELYHSVDGGGTISVPVFPDDKKLTKAPIKVMGSFDNPNTMKKYRMRMMSGWLDITPTESNGFFVYTVKYTHVHGFQLWKWDPNTNDFLKKGSTNIYDHPHQDDFHGKTTGDLTKIDHLDGNGAVPKVLSDPTTWRKPNDTTGKHSVQAVVKYSVTPCAVYSVEPYCRPKSDKTVPKK